MNSYWAERHAIEHIDQLMTEAAGDQRTRRAEEADSPAPDRQVVSGRRTWQRAFSWLQALAARSRRHAAQPR
ncbi:MAG TPA: hypothetical protein VFO05_04000 [Candidatus Limnocylindrales bacterium]|nr:hypothetical protein [Candidatus Limnocylindrales bacterium]